jgi:hypothetical protein
LRSIGDVDRRLVAGIAEGNNAMNWMSWAKKSVHVLTVVSASTTALSGAPGKVGAYATLVSASAGLILHGITTIYPSLSAEAPANDAATSGDASK